jgi:predicted outer membrane repeat protein
MPSFCSARRFALLLILLCSAQVHAATIVVGASTDGTGAANQCELRDAIIAANSNAPMDGCIAGSGDDRIEFNLPPVTISLASSLPDITQSLEIAGPGIDNLTLDGGGNHALLRADFSNGFLTVGNLELFRGNRATGGCLNITNVKTILVEDVRINGCTSSLSGGGAYVSSLSTGSSIVLRRLVVEDNTSVQGGSGMVLVPLDARIEDSVFQANQANQPGSGGGALAIGGSGSALVTRSTFVQNESVDKGSAINIYNANATVHIEHSTISQNTSNGIFAFESGGAIASTGTLSLFNTVIAGNTEVNTNHSNSDFSSAIGTISTLGFNFIGNNEGVAAVFPAGTQANGDRAGTAAGVLDAKLGALADNGGPTLTLMPASDSPLIDKGSCPDELADQRGYGNLSTGLRPIDAPSIPAADDGCDTGAVEYLGQKPEPLFEDGFES